MNMTTNKIAPKTGPWGTRNFIIWESDSVVWNLYSLHSDLNILYDLVEDKWTHLIPIKFNL